ncbi:hypothetical protein [Phaeodactylibacter luteus]|uniref:Tetratricopeptide repeat protein n=1 Tax=Phaeodactylibacter luteus TaxID=1564516 RepID=A0A5C6RHY9_9BACT|nr:hypothetical protein [Phaeodactylibacter luteus]TXB62068.1 hypothetical protein FRY97_16035 [Phaeodactylibacter luteus]
MNADHFHQYLQHPEMLQRVSFQEIKTLVLQYPYSQPLSVLLLCKALMDNRDDWKGHLARASALTTDRRALAALVDRLTSPEPQQESFTLQEEYLELRSLEELDAEQDSLLPLQEEDGAAGPDTLHIHFPEGLGLSPAQEEEDLAWPAGAGPEAEDPPLPDQSPPAPATPEEQAAGPDTTAAEMPNASMQPAPARERWIEHAVSTAVSIAGLSPIKPEPADERMPVDRPLHTGVPKPRPKASFSSWIAQFQPPDIQSQLGDLMEASKKEKDRHSKKKVDHIAARSITENDEIASETLARLLARQGQTGKAVEMYRRLMLVFPEKSDYFAQLIQNLKSD